MRRYYSGMARSIPVIQTLLEPCSYLLYHDISGHVTSWNCMCEHLTMRGWLCPNFNVSDSGTGWSHCLRVGPSSAGYCKGRKNAQHSRVCIAKLLSILRGKGQIWGVCDVYGGYSTDIIGGYSTIEGYGTDMRVWDKYKGYGTDMRR